MKFTQLVMELQNKMNQQGAKLIVDGIAGAMTTNALTGFNVSMVVTKKLLPIEKKYPQAVDIPPSYPTPGPHHPIFNTPAPFTHLHPIDVLRSVAGEKEILGSKDNPLIAHFHEHSGNLGTHTAGAKYHDEVPHCSSALNWAADMSGCRKTNHALARSWRNYKNPRLGHWVEEGDIITIGDSHVTLCNKRFERNAETFEGFGSNQNNTIKTSTYRVDKISSVNVFEPLPGTRLAPIGSLGLKPIASTGIIGESTS